MNDRTVGYYPSESCDTCFEKGAYDFMGDLICDRCIREAESSAVEGQPQPYDNESLRTELATLRSEHGRLRSIAKSAASCHVALEEDNETLRAEVERLRAALVTIARYEEPAKLIARENRGPSTLAVDLAGMARCALSEAAR